MKATINLENRFALLQPDWVQLSPYGDFPHARGLQRVDRAAAEIMVRNFDSFLGRAGRLFGGAPFYIGHPDMPGCSETADRKAYGWVTKIEARPDGLYGRVKWSEPGEELLRNGHFKFFSPYWEAEEIGFEKDKRVYRPVLLMSVGLTNQPNIPVNPLANEERTVIPVDFAQSGTSPARPATTEMPPRVRLALHNALASGLITPADREQWRARLENDYASGLADLGKLSPVLHVHSRTGEIRYRREERALLPNRRSQLQELVRAKMREGLSYDEAWQQLKKHKPHLFEV